MNIGFIGLGTMGAPMARNLRSVGYNIATSVNRNPPPVDLEAAEFGTPAEVAAWSDVVITMLPDTPDVLSVLMSDHGVLAGLRSGGTIIDMSSISPVATASFAERASKAELNYLDAPVSGGETGAIDGTLTIMVGGPRFVFESMKPILGTLGRNVTHIGDKNG